MALPDPISRQDQYLFNIAGEETELPAPVSREDRFLAKIAGMEVELPPETANEPRADQYLRYIATHGGGGDITVEALSVTENGEYTAPSETAYSPVTVNVQPDLEAKTVSVTENGTTTILPSAGKDGISSVALTVNVSGGGGTPEHGVFFLDYDGSVVTAWASSEVASKTALPDNPTHTGLVAQGWTWDLQHIKDYIAACENANVYVRQMYKTASGLTEIDITVTPVTGPSVTCKMSGTKDWDGTPTDTKTSHTYADYGDYTITCDGTSVPAGTNQKGGMFESTSNNKNRYWCTAIRIGGSVTSIGDYAFNCCYSLTSITIPQAVTSIGSYAFAYCYALTSITIPQSVTSIRSHAFFYCYALTSITIPQSVTSIGDNAFDHCYALTSITIPQSVTSIGSYAFSNCYSLTSITIPQSVTSIGSYAFYDCSSITEYDFTDATSVPTLSNTNAFTGINGICKIIVPDALYNDWIAATNWAAYANYIYKASEVTA